MNLPFFAVKAYVPGGGGVQNQAEKNSKNAFRPVPVQKFTFPENPKSWEFLFIFACNCFCEDGNWTLPKGPGRIKNSTAY